MSVLPSPWNNWAPTGRIFTKFARLQLDGFSRNLLGSNWTDFHEIWYSFIFRKCVKGNKVLWKSVMNNGYFTWRPIYKYDNIGCPTTYQTRHFFNNSNTNGDIATKQTHTADTFIFISHTTNVLLFKSRCNIFIGFGIIEEIPGLVGSGTPCMIRWILLRMKNVSDKSCRENQNIFYFQKLFFKSCRLWNYVEKCGRAG
jgi:hypothetical protein